MSELKAGIMNCPEDGTPLHWHQFQGMRLTREIVPPKPKHSYYVYDAKCPKCGAYYEIKKPR